MKGWVEIPASISEQGADPDLFAYLGVLAGIKAEEIGGRVTGYLGVVTPDGGDWYVHRWEIEVADD